MISESERLLLQAARQRGFIGREQIAQILDAKNLEPQTPIARILLDHGFLSDEQLYALLEPESEAAEAEAAAPPPPAATPAAADRKAGAARRGRGRITFKKVIAGVLALLILAVVILAWLLVEETRAREEAENKKRQAEQERDDAQRRAKLAERESARAERLRREAEQARLRAEDARKAEVAARKSIAAKIAGSIHSLAMNAYAAADFERALNLALQAYRDKETVWSSFLAQMSAARRWRVTNKTPPGPTACGLDVVADVRVMVDRHGRSLCTFDASASPVAVSAVARLDREPNCVGLSPDGAAAAVGLANGEVVCCKVSDGRIMWRVRPFVPPVDSVLHLGDTVLAAGGRVVARLGADNGVVRERRSFPGDILTNLVRTEGGVALGVCTSTEPLRYALLVMEPDTFHVLCRAELPARPCRLRCLGTRVALAFDNNIISVFDWRSGRQLGAVRAGGGRITGLLLEKERLLAAEASGVLHCWSMKDWRTVLRKTLHAGAVTDLEESDGRFFVASDRNGVIVVEPPAGIATGRTAETPSADAPRSGRRADFTDAPGRLVVSGAKGKLHVFSAPEMRLLKTVAGPFGEGVEISLLRRVPEGGRILAAAVDGGLALLEAGTMEPVWRRENALPPAAHAFVAFKGGEAAVCSAGTVVFVDLKSGEEKGRITPDPPNALCGVGYAKDGRVFAALDRGDHVFVFDRERLLDSVNLPCGEAVGMCMAPDGETMFVADASGDVFRLDTGGRILAKGRLPGASRHLRTTADAKALLAAQADGALVMLDAVTLAPRLTLFPPGGGADDLALASDGRTLAMPRKSGNRIPVAVFDERPGE